MKLRKKSKPSPEQFAKAMAMMGEMMFGHAIAESLRKGNKVELVIKTTKAEGGKDAESKDESQG